MCFIQIREHQFRFDLICRAYRTENKIRFYTNTQHVNQQRIGRQILAYIIEEIKDLSRILLALGKRMSKKVQIGHSNKIIDFFRLHQP